ncbi:MAG: STAS domain-containing protein [Caulobacteraceae bacterium]|nr:STAS domain-containing protein [Caulobacteraceae bacterium]
MDVQHTDLGDVRKITLAGRLDSAGVDLIEIRFGALIVPVGKHTVVDMTEVSFLASLGVRMLISTTRALSRKGAKLALFGATPPVMEIIETMGFNDIVPVVASESEAIAYVTE